MRKIPLQTAISKAANKPLIAEKLRRENAELETYNLLSTAENGLHRIITAEINPFLTSFEDQKDRHTAALVAHCYNHFEEVVSALSEFLADAETLKTPIRNEAICERARTALAKAEKVKLP